MCRSDLLYFIMQMPKFTNVFQKPYHRSLYYIVYSAFSPCLARFRKRSKVCWCRSRDMKDEVILVDKMSNWGAAAAPMTLSFLDEIQSATEKKWNMALVEGNWSKLNRKNTTKKSDSFIIKKMSHLCLGLFFSGIWMMLKETIHPFQVNSGRRQKLGIISEISYSSNISNFHEITFFCFDFHRGRRNVKLRVRAPELFTKLTFCVNQLCVKN